LLAPRAAECCEPHRAPPQHGTGKSRIRSAEEGRKRIEGQGEMLLPISGKKGKDAVVKPAERPSARQKKAG
jgi:hypothetical protein